MQFCITHGQAHTAADDVDSGIGCLVETWDNVVPGIVVPRAQCARSMPHMAAVIQANSLVYVDTVSGGYVPAKVISIDVTDDETASALVRFTATRGQYRRGMQFVFAVPNLTILARRQVVVSKGKVTIERPARFLSDDGSLL